MVLEQTTEWSDMIARQRLEEHELTKVHVAQQKELLRRLMEEAQAVQVRELELRQDRYDMALVGIGCNFTINALSDFVLGSL